MKPNCVVNEFPDSLEFDCCNNCEACDFKGKDECADYEFTQEEKNEALLKYMVSKLERNDMDKFVMQVMSCVLEKRKN